MFIRALKKMLTHPPTLQTFFVGKVRAKFAKFVTSLHSVSTSYRRSVPKTSHPTLLFVREKHAWWVRHWEILVWNLQIFTKPFCNDLEHTMSSMFWTSPSHFDWGLFLKKARRRRIIMRSLFYKKFDGFLTGFNGFQWLRNEKNPFLRARSGLKIFRGQGV